MANIKMTMVKRILDEAKPNVWLYFGSIGLIICASICEVFGMSMTIPILNSLATGGKFMNNLNAPYLGELIKIAHLQSDIEIFSLLLLLVLLAVGLSNLSLFLSVLCSSRFCSDFTHTLRTRIFKRYLYFGKAFYDRAKLGSMVAVLLGNTDELGSFLASFRSMCVNFIMAAFFLTFLFVLSWQLAIFTLPLIVVIYYSVGWLVKKIRGSAKYRYSATMELSSCLTDVLANISLVRSYANEEHEYGAFVERSNVSRFHALNVQKKAESVPLFSDVIASSGFLVLVFLCGIIYMKTGIIHIGKFLVFFYVLKRFVSFIKPINEFKSIIIKSTPHVEHISYIFDDSDKALVVSGAMDVHALKNKIVFNNVSFGYNRSNRILKNISFKIKKKQTLAIVGPTGAGKTTITNLLCRFYERDSGTIEIDGVDIRNITLSSLRRSIALVAQDSSLFNDTIRNNIVYGIKGGISQQMLDEATRKACIYDYIMGLPDQYDTYVGDRGVKLSGGEKQRISIARAILKNEEILILDEATSSLDSDTERLIQKALDELFQTKTVIAIAHRLSTIKNADWIMVLEDGVITEQGTLDELLAKKGRLHYYWDLQKFR